MGGYGTSGGRVFLRAIIFKEHKKPKKVFPNTNGYGWAIY
ncbi:hypothetical protein OROMI_017942 [Orobanche minor]